ncbi:MAG TPA: hypothetical protein VKS60_12240 [Stellaceae bacterium]|nr:hypothetical protein [Stellaceae bacterium]
MRVVGAPIPLSPAVTSAAAPGTSHNGTYSGSYNTIFLADADATLAAAGRVVDAAAGSAAIYGAFYSGNFTNDGTVESEGSAGVGVALLLYHSGRFTNSGTVVATGSQGIGVLMEGGTLVNSATGTIEASGVDGVAAAIDGAVDNAGTIWAKGSDGIAIVPGGRPVDNMAGGVIIGQLAAIDGEDPITNAGTIEAIDGVAINASDDGAVVNTGLIEGEGSLGFGIVLLDGSAIDNQAGGTITAMNAGIETYGTAVLNAGTVEATGYHGAGIVLHYPKYGRSVLYNLAGGIIRGGPHGVGVYMDQDAVDNAGLIEGYIGILGSGVLNDFGTIASVGGRYAIEFTTPGGELKLHPGAEIFGTIVGEQLSLILAGGDGRGVLHGLGRRVLGVEYATIAHGADWRFTGYNELKDLINDGTLDIGGTFDCGFIRNEGSIIVDGGSLIVDEIAGASLIDISDHGTLAITYGFQEGEIGGVVAFEDATGVVSLGYPADFRMNITGFEFGDTIDLTGVAFSTGETVTDGGGRLTVQSGGSIVAEFGMSNLQLEAGLTLVSDGHGGTDIVGVPLGLSDLGVSLASDETAVLDGAIQSQLAWMAASDGGVYPLVDVYTPSSLSPVEADQPFDTVSQAGDLNIENGAPTAGALLRLGTSAQGIVLTGSKAVTLVGRAVADELLAGNSGNDTIRGGGGSGWLFSGGGHNDLRAGSGNVTIVSGGTDQIFAGGGNDLIEVYASATVHGGAGDTIFIDGGTGPHGDKVHAGSGTITMRSGLGQDTFIGGAGTSKMIDTGAGHVAFQFAQGLGGIDLVTGFNAADGDYIRVVAGSFGARSILGHLTVSGGNSFVALGDGTKIEFVGVTNLVTADFHS